MAEDREIPAVRDKLLADTLEAFSDLRAIPSKMLPLLAIMFGQMRSDNDDDDLDTTAKLLQNWDVLVRHKRVDLAGIGLYALLAHSGLLPQHPKWATAENAGGTPPERSGKHDHDWDDLRLYPLRMRRQADGTRQVMFSIRRGWYTLDKYAFEVLRDYSCAMMRKTAMPAYPASATVARLFRVDSQTFQDRLATLDFDVGYKCHEDSLKHMLWKISQAIKVDAPADRDAPVQLMLPEAANVFATELAYAFVNLYGLWWPMMEVRPLTEPPAKAGTAATPARADRQADATAVPSACSGEQPAKRQRTDDASPPTTPNP